LQSDSTTMQAKGPQADRILKSRVAGCTGVANSPAVLNEYWMFSSGGASRKRFGIANLFGIGAGVASNYANYALGATWVRGRL
jgi:hypothetical protein